MNQMNPVERAISEGVNPLVAFLTNATCGEACWHAREDICRCSCGGKNHGCLRSTDGERPVRTARVDGYMYELRGVGFDVHAEAHSINEAAGILFHYADSSRDPEFRSIPAKTRCATDSQIAKWPELAAYRDGDAWTDEHGNRHYINKPYLLWIKVA